MNYARSGHASCTLGLSVFVFCGIHEYSLSTNTVERLQPFSLDPSKSKRWELIHVSDTEMSPRYWPVAQALNSSEIVIMGGKNDADKSLGTVIIFDTKTDTFK